MSGALRVFGWIFIIGGVVFGLIQGFRPDPFQEVLSRFEEQSFRWAITITWVFSGAVSGIFFLALGRGIELLETIAENGRSSVVTTTSEARTAYPATGKAKPSLESLSKSHTFKSSE